MICTTLLEAMPVGMGLQCLMYMLTSGQQFAENKRTKGMKNKAMFNIINWLLVVLGILVVAL
jgi:ABC-type uncharacterized transport system permease subunit